MISFEGIELREEKLAKELQRFGISSLEEAEKITKDVGLNVYDSVRAIQPICFENACWAYTLGAAVAIKTGALAAARAAELIGQGLKDFRVP